MATVNFYVGLKANYDALGTYDDDALYFLTDTLQIFKGANEYTKSAELVSELPETGQRQGVVYVNLSDFGLYIYNGSEYVQINKTYTTSLTAESASDDTVPTTAAVATYVTNAIADVVGGVGVFVTDVSYEDGVLSVAKGDEPIETTLTGVVNNPTYEAETRTITLPVYGGDTLTIELGKDAFVESGSYNSETETLDLVLTSGDEVTIPVSSLVDVYTGAESTTATVTVGNDNTITADVKLSEVTGNALSISEEGGIYLSLEDYYTKTQVDNLAQEISDALDSHVSDTTVHITAEERETWNAKVSTSDMESAISEALETAASDATTKADAALESAKSYADDLNSTMSDRVTTLESAIEWQTIEEATE